MNSPAEALTLTPETSPGVVRYQDAYVSVFVQCRAAILFYTETQAAGSIGKAQGDALIKALKVCQDESLQSLQIHMNSAGAHFHEPMEGLFYLNGFLETLWRIRSKGVWIRVVSTGWLYGGMAMALATVANELILSASASIGLLGRRVLGRQAKVATPVNSFQPTHLELRRVLETNY